MVLLREGTPESHAWSASSILAALADVSTGIEVKDRLRYEPSGEALVEALRHASTDREREILCDVLGDRHEKLAINALVEQLANLEVRVSAADALAKIGEPAAGGMLATYFERETVAGTRAMLAAALGAVGYEAAIPALIRALEDRSPSMRGSAAWSLGRLRAQAALEVLKNALAAESSGYARQRLEEAVDILSRDETRSTRDRWLQKHLYAMTRGPSKRSMPPSRSSSRLLR
jgi:HEAT repeat protein